MPNYNDTTYTQAIPNGSPQSRPRRRDRSCERYPGDDSREEVYVERRRISNSNDPYSPKGHLTVRHEEMIRRPSRHQHSRSADPPRRRGACSSSSSEDSDSESEVEYRRSRAVARRPSDRYLKVVSRGDEYEDYPRRSKSRNDIKRRSSSSSSSSDNSSSSDEESRKKRKHRNRKFLYTGLAAVTTVAAANNIYQNTKAHHARRKKLQEGEMSEAEAKRLKAKALMLDLATVGVVAVGINNARMGWKRAEAVAKEGR